MLKIIAAGALAAFIAYVVYEGATPARSGLIETAGPQRGLKGNRLPLGPPTFDCSQMAWPHARGNCPSNRVRPDDRSITPREVRIVRLDRVVTAGFRRSV